MQTNEIGPGRAAFLGFVRDFRAERMAAHCAEWEKVNPGFRKLLMTQAGVDASDPAKRLDKFPASERAKLLNAARQVLDLSEKSMRTLVQSVSPELEMPALADGVAL
jgi:hypothetical protein